MMAAGQRPDAQLRRAEKPTERTHILRRTYASCIEADAEERGKQSDSERTAFVRGYLWPCGSFQRTLLTLMENSGEEGLDAEGTELAERFFLDVHPICAVDALVGHVSGSVHRETAKRTWDLLRRVVVGDFGGVCDAVWSVEAWQRFCPESSWEQCCERVVQWYVAIAECAPEQCCEFEASSLMPRVVQRLMDKIRGRQDPKDPKTLLLGALLKRFLNRGNGQPLVTALLASVLECLEAEGSQRSLHSLVQSICDPHAVELFFRQILAVSTERLSDSQTTALLRALSVSHDVTGLSDEMHYTLFHRLLLKESLSKKEVHCVLHVLAESEGRGKEMLVQLGKMWSDTATINRLPLRRQAYLTHLLTCLIPRLPEAFVGAGDRRVARCLMEGVAERLDHALQTIRFQGMRVAHIIAQCQPDVEPIFAHLNLDFQSLREEERWQTTSLEAPPLRAETTVPAADSDDDSNFCESDGEGADSDVEERPQAILMKGRHPVTLLDLQQDLRKSEEPLAVIQALKQLTVLLPQRPAELPAMAAELSKTLIFVPLPEWIHEELQEADAFGLEGLKSPTAVRVSCLTLLMVAAAAHCGESVIDLISSKQLAEYQRLEVLEALRQAAKRLASPPETPGSAGFEQGGGEKLGTSRVWATRALAAKQRPKPPLWRNAFVEAAGIWTTALMRVCRTVTRGFNLMERNPSILGSVLITLGTFAECAATSIVSTSLALTVFPLIRAVMEQKGENCHLRRSSFQAMISLIRSLPPGRLVPVFSALAIKNETDEALAEMLKWTRAAAVEAMESDPDETCQRLAGSSLFVCAELTQAALELQDKGNVAPVTSQPLQTHVPQHFETLSLK